MCCLWCSVSIWLCACNLCTINFERNHSIHSRSKDLRGASDTRDTHLPANYWLVTTLSVNGCCLCRTVIIGKALLSGCSHVQRVFNDIVMIFYEFVCSFLFPLLKYSLQWQCANWHLIFHVTISNLACRPGLNQYAIIWSSLGTHYCLTVHSLKLWHGWIIELHASYRRCME